MNGEWSKFRKSTWVHENKTNEGKKTRIGKVMVMVGGDWQKGLREHWLHKTVAVDAWRKTVISGRGKREEIGYPEGTKCWITFRKGAS